MRCARCGGDADNIATRSDAGPVLVHADLGGCWEGGLHGFVPPDRPPGVVAIDRGFQRLVNGRWLWPWEQSDLRSEGPREQSDLSPVGARE